MCTNQIERGVSLAAASPRLAAEWHPTRNGVRTARQCRANKRETVWWLCDGTNSRRRADCDCRHEFKASPYVRLSTKSMRGGCPWCSDTATCRHNGLATLHPGIEEELHPTLNGKSLDTTLISTRSSRVMWWQHKAPCGCNHTWTASVLARTAGDRGCPQCGRVDGSHVRSESLLCYHGSLLHCYPGIAGELLGKHPVSQEPSSSDVLVEVRPLIVPITSYQHYRWRCSIPNRLLTPLGEPTCQCNHDWTASISYRVEAFETMLLDAPVGHTRRVGDDCPYCSGDKTCEHTSLETLCPKLTREWHPTRNESIGRTPSNTSVLYRHEVWWICKRALHSRPIVWTATVRERVFNILLCPECRTWAH